VGAHGFCCAAAVLLAAASNQLGIELLRTNIFGVDVTLESIVICERTVSKQ